MKKESKKLEKLKKEKKTDNKNYKKLKNQDVSEKENMDKKEKINKNDSKNIDRNENTNINKKENLDIKENANENKNSIESNKNENINKKDYKNKDNNNDIASSENENNDKVETNKSRKKSFTIIGISIWRILAYFIIYSVAGYIIETIYGIITKGVWESRQSFLYGPFCGIYGLGAVIMILFLHKYQKKYNALFIGGFIIGSITEYLVSLFGEMILGVKWWDYSGMPLNINGRICVYFSAFWGFLGIYLIASLNPKVDRLINWVKNKFKTYRSLKAFIITVTILLLLDCIATGFAIEYFLVRMIVKNDIDVNNKEAVVEQYNKIYGNEKLSDFIYKFWGDKKMIKTFPNLKVKDTQGNIVYMDSFLDIQPYYMKVHDKNNKNSGEVEEEIRGESQN